MWWARLLNNLASILGVGGGAANSYESIATVTVGAGGQASIDFNSITSTYKHLQIRGIARSAYSSPDSFLRIRFNSDTGNNYARHILYGNGASALASGAASGNVMIGGYLVGATGTANDFSAIIVDILDYANTNKYKTIRTLAGGDQNGSGEIDFASSLWQNPNAVTSISLFDGNSANLAQYSSFALYGVKG